MRLQALSSKPIGFLRIVGLLFYYIKSGFATTARARARLWQDQNMSYGSEVPDHTMSILLGLAFSVVEPLIAPIGLLYFLVMTLIGKYQMMYVFTEQFQSGGKASHSALVLPLWAAQSGLCASMPPRRCFEYTVGKCQASSQVSHRDTCCGKCHAASNAFCSGLTRHACLAPAQCSYDNIQHNKLFVYCCPFKCHIQLYLAVEILSFLRLRRYGGKPLTRSLSRC